LPRGVASGVRTRLRAGPRCQFGELNPIGNSRHRVPLGLNGKLGLTDAAGANSCGQIWLRRDRAHLSSKQVVPPSDRTMQTAAGAPDERSISGNF
jgi:hypothetical protein